MKLALDIKISGDLTYLYTHLSSWWKEWSPKTKCLEHKGVTTNILKSGAKSSIITNMSYDMQIPRTHPLTLGDRLNFLPLTEPNPTDNLG
jgi:hypothetical protein